MATILRTTSSRTEKSAVPRVSFSTGFTVMEALIAATILSLAALGPISVAHRSLVSANEARDVVVASYLAQEGIEYVRNIRDQIQHENDKEEKPVSNGSNSGNWLYLLEECPSADSPCGIDVTETDSVNSFQACTAISDCRITYNSSAGYYGHQTGGSWQSTKFKRKVVITETVNNQEAYVSVVVEWPSRSVGTRQFTVDTRLFKLDY